MTILYLAPVIQPETPEHRTFFIDPTGSFYMIGTPSLGVVQELIEMGIRRIVFSAYSEGEDWEEAERLLLEAGIEISGKLIDTEILSEVI